MSQVSEFDLPDLSQPFENANENNPTSVNSDPLPCVGFESAGRNAHKLKLIFKNGDRRFFPYAYISEVAFDAEGKVTILTSEREIIIEGRGLDNLEEWLFESKVRWVKEDNRSFDPFEENIFVAKIEVKDRSR